MEGLKNAMSRTISQTMSAALLSGSVQGYDPLRELIAARCRGLNTRVDASRILITSGSQQGIDLVARTMVDPGDVVAVEAPTYPGAIRTFRAHGANLISVPTDNDGVDVSTLEMVFEQRRPKLLYLIPNFANPTGVVLSIRRRRKVLELAARYGVLIIEDDAYGELYFRDPPPQSLLTLANDDERQWLVHLSSFSNVIAPGLRLAWLTAPDELLRHMLVAKETSDIHSSAMSQMIAYHFLNAGSLEPALSRARTHYARQASTMRRAIDEEFARGSLVSDSAKGGMFQWMEFVGVNTQALVVTAINAGIAYAPGAQFFVDGTGTDCLRLAFANASVEQIREGVRRLASVIYRKL
ncbi:aminotransferase-like domain-containing protein [Burkholderia cepacia]|uniref:aminotransferase-like domain-containing protein n=1 Tax=Burkholderia cepacia TaxID=292 RepID=UPI002AB6CBFF|nr:PLP-dependent aminotransferase family protein [Burkholderia cepacia]